MTLQKIKTDLFIAIARLIARLPLFVILNIGGFLGYLTWLMPNKRKKIAARNIALCFPELNSIKQQKLLKQNLVSTGYGFAEMIIAFWSKTSKFNNRIEFTGLEHVRKAHEDGKACILLSCHLHPLELSVRAINNELQNMEQNSGNILARQHNNKVFEAHIDKARHNYCDQTIDKKDVKTVLKSLKSNHPVYYIPDQNFSYQCEYIDFFNQPAATVIAPVRLAQVSKSPVIPWFGFRVKDKNGKIGWKIQLLEPLECFQDKDIVSSLKTMNKLFEQQIRKHPEQYLWVHRRFKNHPKGKNFLYKDL